MGDNDTLLPTRMSYPRPVTKPKPLAEVLELPWLSWKLPPPTRTRGLGVPPSLSATVRPPPLVSELKLQPPLQVRPLAPYPSPKAPQKPWRAAGACAGASCATLSVSAPTSAQSGRGVM